MCKCMKAGHCILFVQAPSLLNTRPLVSMMYDPTTINTLHKACTGMVQQLPQRAIRPPLIFILFVNEVSSGMLS